MTEKLLSNPYKLSAGDTAILDCGYSNSCEVIIKSLTPMGIFATVSAGGDEWQTMTYRLSPVEQPEKTYEKPDRF